MAKNIDDFNRGVGLILSQLYDKFPEPITLDVREFNDHSDLAEPSDVRIIARRNVYGHTVKFLASERYLTFGTDSRNMQFTKAVLTSKGLAALSKTPETFSNKPTVGDRIQGALNESGTETIKGIVRMILSGI